MLSKLNKLFRMSKGPFHSGRFGKLTTDAREILLQSLEADSLDSSLQESWLIGVARDQRRDNMFFSKNELIALLKKKTGQIESSVASLKF